MIGEHPTGFWWCSLAHTTMKRRFSGRMQSRKDSLRAGGAQSRWVPLVHCVQSARKKEGGVLMPRFFLSM